MSTQLKRAEAALKSAPGVTDLVIDYLADFGNRKDFKTSKEINCSLANANLYLQSELSAIRKQCQTPSAEISQLKARVEKAEAVITKWADLENPNEPKSMCSPYGEIMAEARAYFADLERRGEKNE